MAIVLDLWADLSGAVLPYAGENAPEGWLMCFGQEVSRDTYSNLFAAIGVTHGAGDGETTFVLPDGRGRVIAGVDDMGGVAATRLTQAAVGFDATLLGAAGGGQTQTLTTAHMPTHNHNLSDPGHGHGVNDPTHAHGVADPGHTHGHNALVQGQTSTTGGGSFGISSGVGAATISAAGTGIGIYGAYTGITVAGAGTGITIQDAGGGAPHSIMQPTLMLNHIIKI